MNIKFSGKFMKCITCHRIVVKRDYRWGDTIRLERFRMQQCGCFKESTGRNMMIKVTVKPL